MVMHARKPQRISDGYFEHQTHPYQKYGKSERRAEYLESRYSPLRSPNGAGHHGHHSAHAHHYSHCPDDRPYTSRNSYVLQKSCEKERDRDYKSSRDKYADSARSPKEKRSERSNHERSDCEKKSRTSGMNVSVSRSNKYEKRGAPTASAPSVGEWSEHISSSGKKYYYNCVSEVSQWQKPREWDSRRNSSKDSSYSSRSNHEKRSNSRSGREEKPKRSDRYWPSSREEESHERTRTKRPHEDGQSLQDMDISPDRSTPLSEHSYREPRAEGAPPPVVVIDNSNHTTGSLLAAALPRIVAAPATSNNGGASPETPGLGSGPPTPTHSENTDPHAPPIHLDSALPRKMEGLGSYSSVVGGALQQAPPMLTPSLVNYVRVDLTAHVTGWPADLLEKQANKFSEEQVQLGCLQCTRVSAELKCTRSLVRHTEVQATLQEQKIMYLRQQIALLEELKSQNSFMSED